MKRNSFQAKAHCLTCGRSDIRVEAGFLASHLDATSRSRCAGSKESIVGARQARQKRMQPGQKSDLWRRKIAPALHDAYDLADVPKCEIAALGLEVAPKPCFGKTTIAHSRKQRNANLEEWLTGHARACLVHHHLLDEVLDAEEMYDAVQEAIRRRGWKFTIFHRAIEQYWPDIQACFPGRWIREIGPLIERRECTR